ncbi:MAG: replication-associated recombination protein A [Cytophagales bacterium]
MRPQSLEDYIGQDHLMSQNGVLRKMIEQKKLVSMILWGPPGVGKTTLAMLMAKAVGREFVVLSAISSGVKEVREVIEAAKYKNACVLFIDEIHRFNKTQQDALLGAVERGDLTLVGATTENPSFEVNSALLSRCQVYQLKQLTENEQKTILKKAIESDNELKKLKIEISEYDAFYKYSNGDARKLLNILEIVINAHDFNSEIKIHNQLVVELVQKNIAIYDKSGEMHYDVISAFIKSIRGSDPHAAVYWLARMIAAGEDLKFIARRLIISASEDIGNANPTALVIANNCFQAVNVVGYPESEIILSQCVVYLACSPKSNASYLAIKKARRLVDETGSLSVPLHLRNAPTALMKKMNYGKDYKYAHDFPEHFVQQQYMPDELKQTKIYEPQENPKENEFKRMLDRFWKGWY